MAFNVFHNPTNVSIGGVRIDGVQSVVMSSRYKEVHATGDEEHHESVARYMTARTSGVMTLADPVSAEAAAGAVGTLAFTWKDSKGVAKTVTLAYCSFGGFDPTVPGDRANTVTLPFMADGTPVVTD